MDYEKLYKEALERAKGIMRGECEITFVYSPTLFDYLFPELKSEDERIRKELIFYLGDMPEDTELRNGVTNRDVLVWLEKQGNDSYLQEKIENFTNAHKGEDPEGIIAACRGGEEQGEHKPANEPKFKVGDTIRLKNSLAEFTIESISNGRYYFKGSSIDIIACDRDYELVVPNLANSAKTCEDDWSNEDEEKFRDVIRLVEQGAPVQSMREHYTNWLKSLKERVQSKQEWSKEDEEEFMSLIGYMSYNGMYDSINFLRRKLNK